jgi:hypothetical protein
VEVNAIEASMGGADLILCADSFLKQFLLNVDCVSGKRLFVAHPILERVEIEEKPHRKGRTRTQTGASRQVRNMMDFHALVDAQELQTRAYRWMLNRIVSTDVLNLGIGDAAVILEERRQPPTSDVTALVDGGREYRASVLAIPHGIVGAATKE